MPLDLDMAHGVWAACAGYLFYVLKGFQIKIDHTMDSRQIRQLIEDKLEPLKTANEGIKLDIRRLESKIDHLLDLLIRGFSDRDISRGNQNMTLRPPLFPQA